MKATGKLVLGLAIAGVFALTSAAAYADCIEPKSLVEWYKCNGGGNGAKKLTDHGQGKKLVNQNRIAP